MHKGWHQGFPSIEVWMRGKLKNPATKPFLKEFAVPLWDGRARASFDKEIRRKLNRGKDEQGS